MVEIFFKKEECEKGWYFEGGVFYKCLDYWELKFLLCGNF